MERRLEREECGGEKGERAGGIRGVVGRYPSVELGYRRGLLEEGEERLAGHSSPVRYLLYFGTLT